MNRFIVEQRVVIVIVMQWRWMAHVIATW